MKALHDLIGWIVVSIEMAGVLVIVGSVFLALLSLSVEIDGCWPWRARAERLSRLAGSPPE